MKFILPKEKYNKSEIEKIDLNYKSYLEEKDNKKLINEYVEDNIEVDIQLLKEKEFCLSFFLFSLVNLFFSFCCMFAFNEYKLIEIFYNTFLICLVLFFIPLFICNIISVICQSVLYGEYQKIDEKKKCLIEEYNKNLILKYKKFIVAYDNYQKEQFDISDLKSKYYNYMKDKIHSADIRDLKNIIIWYLKESGYKIYESRKKELCAILDRRKFLIIVKKINRSLSITDVVNINEQRLNHNFDNAYLFYIGKMSDKACKYCVRNNIVLFNEKSIVTKLYELKLKKDNYIE